MRLTKLAPMLASVALALLIVMTLLLLGATNEASLPKGESVQETTQSPSPVTKILTTSEWTEYADAISPTTDLESAQNIPMFPNATDVMTASETLQMWKPMIRYETQNSIHDVVAFYKAILPRKNWSLALEDTNDYGIGLRFLWIDKEGTLPYRLVLFVGISKDFNGTAGRFEEGPAFVATQISKWPWVVRIPIFPGGELISRDLARNKDGLPVWTMLFRTTDSSSAVEMYYRSKLPEYGWFLGDGAAGAGPIEKGVHFHTFDGLTSLPGAVLKITARIGPRNETIIVLEATGEETEK